jgi:hypothetical protein
MACPSPKEIQPSGGVIPHEGLQNNKKDDTIEAIIIIESLVIIFVY